LNPFATLLPSSSALFIAWNRYAQNHGELVDVDAEIATINLVDAFLAGETVFSPDELPLVSNDLRALVRKGAIKSSVAASASNRLRLE
jgi:hypothetical protein